MIQYVFYALLLLFALYASLFLTGRDTRSYSVLGPDAVIEVNHKKMSIEQLASDYQPRMYIRSSTPSPKLLWTWYEAVLRDGEIDIVYYQNWEDEINPNPIIHKFYWLFRSTYYGYPTYDIEVFQISVSLETGDVTQLLFETSPSDDFYVTISEHIIARYTKQSDGLYKAILTSKENNNVIDELVESVQFEGSHVLVLAQTWNHLTALLSAPSKDGFQLLDSPLRYLTDRNYSSFKFVRKSQGDHRTYENKFSSAIASIGIFVLVTLPATLLKYLTAGKNKRASAS